MKFSALHRPCAARWLLFALLTSLACTVYGRFNSTTLPIELNRVHVPDSPPSIIDSAGLFPAAMSSGAIGLSGTNPLFPNASDDSIQLRASTFGRSFYQPPFDFYFGDVIAAPEGFRAQPVRSGESFQTADGLFSPPPAYAEPFYYSPHVKRVYASQSGNVTLYWVSNEPDAFGNFTIQTSAYAVSSSSLLPTNILYWTENVYAGHPVAIPLSVKQVNVIFNADFPEFVAEEDVHQPDGVSLPPWQVPSDGSTDPSIFLEQRTLWFESGLGILRAYNKTGRVLVELLGEKTGEGTRAQIGLLLVSVEQEQNWSTQTVALGQALTPDLPESQWQDLYPVNKSVLDLNSGTLVSYVDLVKMGDNRSVFFAERETKSPGDVVLCWLRPDHFGIFWPVALNNYNLVWPSSIEDFVINVVDPDAPAATATRIPSSFFPEIVYQDDPDGSELFFNSQYGLTANLRDDGANRALLKFRSGMEIWYLPIMTLPSSSGEHSDFYFEDRYTAYVGERITPPLAADASVGYVNPAVGTNYNPDAYIDPMANGFQNALSGAIIPVNAYDPSHPEGTAHLEVWWYKRVAPPSAAFDPLFFPSLARRYEIRWDVEQLAAPDFASLEEDWEISGGVASFIDLGSQRVLRLATDTVEVHGPAFLKKTKPIRRAFSASFSFSIDKGSSVGADSFYFVIHNDPRGALAKNSEPPQGGWWWASYADIANALVVEFDTYMNADDLLHDEDDLHIAVFQNPSLFNHSNSNAELLRIPKSELLAKGFVFDDGAVYHFRFDYDGAGTIHLAMGTESGGSVAWSNLGVIYDADIPALLNAESGFATFGFESKTGGVGETYYIHHFNYSSPTTRLVIADCGQGPANQLDGLNAPSIYRQPDPALHGYNPNEEHALILGNKLYALRTDLNTTTMPPMVLVNYTGPDGRPAMRASRVIRADGPNDFEFSAVAGQPLGLPEPLNALPAALDSAGNPASYESVQADVPWVDASPPAGAHPTELANYLGFTFTDRNGTLWVHRGPHSEPASPAESPSFDMFLFYPSQEGFDYPNLPLAPAVGTPQPFASTDGSLPSVVSFRPTWPTFAPTIKANQTLTLAQDGLPEVFSATAAELIYDQARALAASYTASLSVASARLVDPIQEKVYLFGPGTYFTSFPVDAFDVAAFQGKLFFNGLAPHLKNRFWFDPHRGTHGAIVLTGKLIDDGVGSPYLELNTLSADDLAAILALASGSGYEQAWHDAVVSMAIPSWSANRFASDLSVVNSPAVPVANYALLSTGTHAGFVTLVTGNSAAAAANGEVIAMHVIRVSDQSDTGSLRVQFSDNPLEELVSFRHSADFGGQPQQYRFQWRYALPDNGLPPAVGDSVTDPDSQWLPCDLYGAADYAHRYVVQGTNPMTLGDSYIIMRYALDDGNANWSDWTQPQLVEGWIKRVLAALNPFNQRVSDLFSNTVNTDVSMLTQAGERWEGDVAMNIQTVDDFGLIEIYETVLNRGKSLSIDASPPSSFPAACDALLLAAGYLCDLYMLLGNEAWSDALNPTIAYNTEAGDFGAEYTSLFAFKGQVPNLLEEELALLRGRDDFLQPGTLTAPCYNRLYWNYTRGIDSGEVVYALNYNIREKPGSASEDGIVDAQDARHIFPQGHGDAYGHFLTALSNYYHLLTDPEFQWTPRTEAVLVLGQAIQVDYMDERKFAGAAAALARTAAHIVSLEHHKSYNEDAADGWAHLADLRVNPTTHRVRHWGVDDWARRGEIGAYTHWLFGNSLLPEVAVDKEGLLKIDRTTVPELDEIARHAQAIQTEADNANMRVNPLGIPKDSIAFDISPTEVAAGKTHFEQIFDRALKAIENASHAFDRASRNSNRIREQETILNDYQTALVEQEWAYNCKLIEIFGTPYPGDIGTGKLYDEGYEGPDLYHYIYIDPSALFNDLETTTFSLDTQSWTPIVGNKSNIHELFASAFDAPKEGLDASIAAIEEIVSFIINPAEGVQELLYPKQTYNKQTMSVSFTLQPGKEYAFADNALMGFRQSSGTIQEALNELYLAEYNLRSELSRHVKLKYNLDRSKELFEQVLKRDQNHINRDVNALLLKATLESAAIATRVIGELGMAAAEGLSLTGVGLDGAIPETVGYTTMDILSLLKIPVWVGIGATYATGKSVLYLSDEVGPTVDASINWAKEGLRILDNQSVLNQQWRAKYFELEKLLQDLASHQRNVDHAINRLNEARRLFMNEVAKGETLLTEREVFRRRSAAVIHGYRTSDLGFRLFRDEALEQYKTLYQTAARYSYLAAKAYDYETGLLSSAEGSNFLKQIVSSRSLGAVVNGLPQFSGGDHGDPGLASSLAELHADWQIVKARLGFNNPDEYGTAFSLRYENFRIADSSEGNSAWRQQLESCFVADLRADADVLQHCMRMNTDLEEPVPGFLIEFSTMIEPGMNFFGKDLSAIDHAYSDTAFAVKIHSVGVAFDGYKGMDPLSDYVPGITSEPVVLSSDPLALSANPYVFLIPAGVDFMRTPPIGDSGAVRAWQVHDFAIPLPFDIGNLADDGEFWRSGQSLEESLFTPRKHPAFRAVDNPLFFNYAPLSPAMFTNSRLVGRSAWNSKWKLVIPARTLHHDTETAKARFIQTVEDIELYLRTYAYSGN